MNDLISRAEVLEAIEEYMQDSYIRDADIICSDLQHEINILPSSDAVQGEWLVKEKDDANGYYWWRECSKCGWKPLLDRWNHGEVLSNFCPHCGADMRKKDGVTNYE